MEEYEQLQKFFIEKQKENMRLKQELNTLKEKLSDEDSEPSRISDMQKENKASMYFFYKNFHLFFFKFPKRTRTKFYSPKNSID